MKLFKKLKSDTNSLINDLRETNDVLMDMVEDYQKIIFEQNEVIKIQHEEIERLRKINVVLSDGRQE